MVESATKLPVERGPENRPAPSRPRQPFDTLRDEIDRVFDAFRTHPHWRDAAFDVAPFFRREALLTAPAIDIAETDAAYEISMELPGIDEENVEISQLNGVLTIRGEKREESEHKKKDYYVAERRYGSFERSFRLPNVVDSDKISASFNRGVLAVTLPKAQNTPQPEKKIQIKAG